MKQNLKFTYQKAYDVYLENRIYCINGVSMTEREFVKWLDILPGKTRIKLHKSAGLNNKNLE